MPRFHPGQFSTKSMNSLTSGRNFLRLQVENFWERSSNCCFLGLRKLVYGILSDVDVVMGRHELHHRKARAVVQTTLRSNVCPSRELISRAKLSRKKQLKPQIYEKQVASVIENGKMKRNCAKRKFKAFRTQSLLNYGYSVLLIYHFV